ncbi:MAG: Cof-type HAD-IIB family hydrolase [Ignavibacterium sp.]|jgi:Cof subfamily protein (haloacid dehalogenase superfamily)|nr:Cof-type HAD-IIB family hydrolase [Ignavibacterium sp.]
MLDFNKLKKIEFILFDVDGTLVNDAGELGERTKQLIMNLKKSGVNFSFASGRLHSALIPLAEELKLHSPIISLDGTVIKSITGKNFVYRSYLKEKHVKKAIELSEKYMVNIALCHNDAIYYTEQNSVIPKLMEKSGAPYKEVESYDNLTSKTLELVFAGDNRPAVAYIRDKFIFPFSLGTSISFFRSQTHESIYYLEIRRSGSSKGKAMKRLLKHLNIQEEKTAVFGDWYNDISMFESKALKIAPSNAISELKRKADLVLKNSNNEEAAAEFLEELLKVKMS